MAKKDVGAVKWDVISAVQGEIEGQYQSAIRPENPVQFAYDLFGSGQMLENGNTIDRVELLRRKRQLGQIFELETWMFVQILVDAFVEARE